MMGMISYFCYGTFTIEQNTQYRTLSRKIKFYARDGRKNHILNHIFKEGRDSGYVKQLVLTCIGCVILNQGKR